MDQSDYIASFVLQCLNNMLLYFKTFSITHKQHHNISCHVEEHNLFQQFPFNSLGNECSDIIQ